MSRPKGAKNKPKYKGGVQILNFDKQIANSPVTKTNTMYGIVNYGEKNDYPYKLLDLYNTSVTMRACVDFSKNAIIGDGIDWENINVEDAPNPNYYTSWFSFLSQLAYDFVMFDAFAFQIIMNRDKKTFSFFNQPIDTVRLEEMDEDGVINNAYLCKDWTNPVKYPPVKVPMFGFQDDATIKAGQVYLFYYHRHNPINSYYGLPTYTSAINSIQAEAAYQVYDHKQVSNGFTPSGILTLNAVETDEERMQIIKNVTAMFTGADNAGNVMISFRDNDEQQAPAFTPFSAQTEHIDLYDKANERTVNRIMAAFKIPSKALIGYPCDDTGFSNSGEFLEAAFRLYNVNCANQNRNEMLDIINKLFAMNGIDVKIILKPLKYNYDGQSDNNNEVVEDRVEDDKTEQGSVTDETATERENNSI